MLGDTRLAMIDRVVCVRSIAMIGLLLLAGCATQPPISHASRSHGLLHLEILELPPTVEDRSLRRVLHDGAHAEVTDVELAADRRRINQSLEATLQEIAPNIEIAPFVDPIAIIGRPLDSASLAILQSSRPADAYLRLSVTDYGETPRRWRGAYITFEVVTTLAITAALAVHKVTRPIAGVYLLEESIEEFSEGYAGFWALNRLSRPVRIDADVIDGHTGQVLWREAHTGLAPWRWRNVRHMNDTTRDELLATSMRKAVKAFSESLHSRMRAGTEHQR